MLLSRRTLISAAGAATGLALLSACTGKGDKITFLVGNDEQTVGAAEALIKAFNESQDDATFTSDTRPGGTEGDNLVKTRLGTQDMPDVFIYNAGSLFQAIQPEKNLLDLSDQDWIDRVDETFKPAVSVGEKVFGAPYGASGAGGILYHKPTYEKLGLDIPLTWDQFISNCKEISKAGTAGLIQSFGDSYTSQYLLLSDFHNLAQANPDFADDYTAHKIGFADDVAFRPFERIAELRDLHILNDDYVSATYQQALGYIADGTGAHYPTQTGAITEIQASNPDAIDDIGFFAQPGDDADTNGLTLWLPGGLYIPSYSEKSDVAKQFIDYAVSKTGLDAMAAFATPTAPYMVTDVDLPSDVPTAVKDLQPYFDKKQTTPALEYLSPIKGPNLENILIELGTGSIDAKTAAKQYDQDVTKQAQQLGLKGW